MKQELRKSDDQIGVVTSNGEVKKGTIVLDPIHHINKIAKVCKNTVEFEDGCGTHLRSVKKIEALIIDGIEINIIN